MKHPLRKIASIFISFIYFSTQVALGALAESHIWKERQKTVELQRKGQKTVLASLPGNLASVNSKALLKQFPASNPQLEARLNWDGESKKTDHLPPSLRSLLEAIPSSYAHVKNVYASPDPGSPALILIQDVHLNSEAQLNIASVIERLLNKKIVDAVAAEGAFRPFDFTALRAFSDKAAIRQTAEAFARKGDLSAVSFAGITSSAELPRFIGVDDPGHYEANVESFTSAQSRKSRVQRCLEEEIKANDQRKRQSLSKDLKEFDDLRNSYRKGSIGFGNYLRSLSAKDAGSKKAPFHEIDLFLKAYELESSLDFRRVESERRFLLENLTPKLTQNEMKHLLNNSLLFRSGRLGSASYYENFQELCRQKGLSLSKTPEFEKYIRYVLLSGEIKGEPLFASLRSLERRILDQLIKSPEERASIQESDLLYLIGKLTSFELTPEEWEEYGRLSAISPQLSASKASRPKKKSKNVG